MIFVSFMIESPQPRSGQKTRDEFTTSRRNFLRLASAFGLTAALANPDANKVEAEASAEEVLPLDELSYMAEVAYNFSVRNPDRYRFDEDSKTQLYFALQKVEMKTNQPEDDRNLQELLTTILEDDAYNSLRIMYLLKKEFEPWNIEISTDFDSLNLARDIDLDSDNRFRPVIPTVDQSTSVVNYFRILKRITTREDGKSILDDMALRRTKSTGEIAPLNFYIFDMDNGRSPIDRVAQYQDVSSIGPIIVVGALPVLNYGLVHEVGHHIHHILGYGLNQANRQENELLQLLCVNLIPEDEHFDIPDDAAYLRQYYRSIMLAGAKDEGYVFNSKFDIQGLDNIKQYFKELSEMPAERNIDDIAYSVRYSTTTYSEFGAENAFLFLSQGMLVMAKGFLPQLTCHFKNLIAALDVNPEFEDLINGNFFHLFSKESLLDQLRDLKNEINVHRSRGGDDDQVAFAIAISRFKDFFIQFARQIMGVNQDFIDDSLSALDEMLQIDVAPDWYLPVMTDEKLANPIDFENDFIAEAIP